MDVTRRNWLRGRYRPQTPGARLPWLKSGATFYDTCTRCHQCVQSCPRQILVADGNGFPTVDFRLGECTFCYQCAEACKQDLFIADPTTRPWDMRALIGRSCLTNSGVTCRCCEDACEIAAISFKPQLGGVSTPRLDQHRCTGCGACVAVCPVGALSVETGSEQHQTRHQPATKRVARGTS